MGNGLIQVANAGHHSILIRDMDHSIDKKGKSGGTPLGIRQQEDYPSEVVYSLSPKWSLTLLDPTAADVFDHVPDLLVLERFAMSHHSRSWRTILNDPEHLPGGNAFHGF